MQSFKSYLKTIPPPPHPRHQVKNEKTIRKKPHTQVIGIRAWLDWDATGIAVTAVVV